MVDRKASLTFSGLNKHADNPKAAYNEESFANIARHNYIDIMYRQLYRLKGDQNPNVVILHSLKNKTQYEIFDKHIIEAIKDGSFELREVINNSTWKTVENEQGKRVAKKIYDISLGEVDTNSADKLKFIKDMVDGTTFSIKDSNKILTVPGQGKQDSLDAAQYAYENAHLLKNNINKELSTYEHLAQALQIHNSFILASRASILDDSVIRRLNEKQPIINDVDSLIDYYKYKVDEDIVDFGIRSDKKFADYSSSRLHQEIINDLFDQDKLARKLLASTDDRAKLAEKIKVKEEFCFVAGTLVHTDKGLVPIQELKIGDKVLSKDESGEGELVYKPVIRTIKSATKQKIITPVEGIYCTDNHPFWTHVSDEEKPRWVAAKFITSNDIVNYIFPERGHQGEILDISGRYHEEVYDPYQIGGKYVIATSDPKVGLYMHSCQDKHADPGEIDIGVIDFRNGEAVEVFTNDDNSLLGRDLHSEDGSEPYAKFHKFLDKDNPENRVEIEYYSKLVAAYRVPDWENDSRATSNAFTDYVYNIEVADTHTYFVGKKGIWVHNTNCTGDVRRDIERGFRVGHSLGTVKKTGFLFE